jgi:hypothetical protein
MQAVDEVGGQRVNIIHRKDPSADRSGDGEEPEAKREDAVREVQAVLQNRRSEARDEPFTGFGSHPGRF